MADEQLYELESSKKELTPDAQQALDEELKRRSPKSQVPESPPQVQGVGGWLALFIFGLVVGGPLITVYKLSEEYRNFIPAGGGSPGGLLIVGTDISISSAITAYGIYAGVSLFRGKPKAVTAAKRFLITLFIYSVLIVLLVILAGVLDPNQKTDTESLGASFRGLLYVLVWYSYLKKSKRVAATYPVTRP
jgi:Protein of unknown function (DUF2569)